MKLNYGESIRAGFEYLLETYPEVFCIGQGLWSPWYVGNSMTDLEKKFGKKRVIDSPVSELACTGAAVGASICGQRPIVIHPRVDFFLLGVDQLVNQAAKWRHMFGEESSAPVTVRAVVNRGGEQGAQHSQSLYSWFAHIPGLRVVLPATPADARDLLIASVLSDDPVLYIDDRWLYELEDDLPPAKDVNLNDIQPVVRREGTDLTIVASSFSSLLALQTADALAEKGVAAEVIDLRVVNPLKMDVAIASARKTGRLLAIDGDWTNCGLAGEILASVTEALEPSAWKATPRRLTLPDAPAPTSGALEKIYYPTVDQAVALALTMGVQ